MRKKILSEDFAIRTLATPHDPLPRIALLGQLPYTVLVSGAGSGVSRHGDIAINRWRNDGTRDNYGQWCYLRDVRTGRVWSAGHQPVCAESSWYRVTLANDRATFHRRDGSFETLTEIVVVPGAAAESRRVIVLNLSDAPAEIELTSYQEVVLASHVSDRGHRAFGNLFVQTEWLSESASILAMRRPRSAKADGVWCGHTIATGNADSTSLGCETDRARFIGRGRSAQNPVAMDNPGDLSGTVGAVLDPVLALRTRVAIPAGGSAQVIFTTFVAKDRDEATQLAARFHDPRDAEKSFDLAGAEAERELSDLDVSSADAVRYQDLAGTLLYGSRPAGPLESDAEAEPGRAELLAIGITGDHPIVFVNLRTADGLRSAPELLRLHRFWNRKGIGCDLVILCGDGDDESSARLADDVVALIETVGEGVLLDEQQGLFVRRRDALGSRQIALLDSVARIRLECAGQALIEVADG